MGTGMQCPQCQHENPEAAKFCNACGAKLDVACPQCAHVNPLGSRFCNECGTPLTGKQRAKKEKGETAKRKTTSNSEPQTLDARRQTLDVAAERRQLTVMFCDLVGSTALSAQLIQAIRPCASVSEHLHHCDPTLRWPHRAVSGRWAVGVFRLSHGT